MSAVSIPTGSDASGGLDAAAWIRRALLLIAATLGYNLVEAGVALWAGVSAGSIALIGFGLDSVIEAAAATVVLWRFRIERGGADVERIARTERRAHAFIGVTFLALAVYVTAQAGWTLWRKDAPEESWLGIGLAVLSLILMPLLAWGKLRAAAALASRSLRAEAKETLACAWLSFALLLGLVANAAAGWWWADPVAALGMVPWLVREGREALVGEAEAAEGEMEGAAEGTNKDAAPR